MLDLLFYLLSVSTVAGALGVIVNKNPVASAFCLTAALVGLAALFILLNAYLVGVIQLLVCGGAVMVLFLSAIMLTKMAREERRKLGRGSAVAGALVAIVFVVQLAQVLREYPPGAEGLKALPADAASNVGQVGNLLFTQYYFPGLVVVVLLLVATTGVMMLRKREPE